MNTRRYYPNLIPSEHRILSDYFRGDPSPKQRPNEMLSGISLALGTLLLIVSLFTTDYMPLFFACMATGLLLIPGISRGVARLVKIRLTAPVCIVSFIVLLSVNIPFAFAFGLVKADLAKQEHFEQIRQQEVQRLAAEMNRQREDSLEICLQRAETFHANGQTDKALQELDRADSMVRTLLESKTVNRKRVTLSLVKVSELVRKHSYAPAIVLLDKLHAIDSNNAEILYQRAICYSKTDRIAAAVSDAKAAKLNGHEAAGKLYEKLNPLRKRVAYRTTLCNDGTYSSSTGRGTCSHHGGVDQYNYPVYETYRKYE